MVFEYSIQRKKIVFYRVGNKILLLIKVKQHVRIHQQIHCIVRCVVIMMRMKLYIHFNRKKIIEFHRSSLLSSCK
jgi:hypothetical protein